jgi:phosphopantothenoylcysteine synthetase/decarboxylase
MHLLVTAGNTQAPIDRVRCITNVFSGRTGAAIALRAWERGHTVTIVTSHPEAVDDLRSGGAPFQRLRSIRFRTFDDLHGLMAQLVPTLQFDGVVHCAAVSDYLVGGVYGAADGTDFDNTQRRWSVQTTAIPNAGKLKSDAPELWLRLVRAPKLIDSVRSEWGFNGVLVKFKLEVDVTETELLDVAERSRRQSGADLMVANTLEGMAQWAYLGPFAEGYERVPRQELADRLLDAIEARHAGG